MVESNHTGLSSKQHPIRKVVYVTVFLIFLLGIACVYWIHSYSKTPGPAGQAEIVITIPKGASFNHIRSLLAEHGLIYDDIRFTILARYHGLAGKVRAGEFLLFSGKFPLDVLRELVSARSIQHRVTIPEGLRADEIAKIFVSGGWCTKGEFLKLVYDQLFIKDLGFSDLNSLEGYLYPDTYYLTRIPAVSAEGLVEMMVKRFHEVWQEVNPGTRDRHDVVILASIVEKETAEPSERARIASVFRNRLDKGMRLQSDPTVIYGIEDFSGDITKNDLKRSTPYNTYVIKGLPEGPISNPGKYALSAVINPSSEKFLYFVSKNDGTHFFSKTLKEHNRAVHKYQRTEKNRR